MEAEIVSLEAKRHAQDLRESWQGRILAHTQKRAIGLVVLSMLAHNFDEAMPVLLRVVFPGFEGLRLPGLCSAGKVDRNGTIVADYLDRDGRKHNDVVIFTSLDHLQGAFRRVADELKLTDQERLELFSAVKRWVVADRRIDPTMDPRDPEAKRLVH
jgi:hypothetical protein